MAVWHLISELQQALGQPKLVQKRLEYIALRHMNADIATADIEACRNILFEVCAWKLGGLMTPEFQFGLDKIVLAVGTSLATTHEHYAARLKLLTSCRKEGSGLSGNAVLVSVALFRTLMSESSLFE